MLLPIARSTPARAKTTSGPRILFWIVLVLWLAFPATSFAQTVWSGPPITFSKSGSDDPTLPVHQDIIVPGVVAITRASSMGIYNAATEAGYSASQSPADTEWAFPNNNPGQTIEAGNYAALQFDVWRAAHAGSPPSTVDQPAVMHIISEDIYIDVMFTDWGSGQLSGDASFAYRRATPAVPGPAPGWVVVALLSTGSASLAWRGRMRKA